MDRTARMLRRTLLCAVLACSLAVWRIEAAWIAQTVLSLLPYKRQTALWHKKADAPLFRGMVTLFPSLALQAALTRMTHPPILIVLTGALCQASLIGRAQKTGRRAQAACLISLLLFIACTR